MIAIKSTAMKELPEVCEYCCWFECRPHPAKGWTDICGLMVHCMDDSEPEEWIYDGNSRPKACPLIGIKEDEG